MKLSVRDGKLRLRSAFKLMFFAWVFSMAAFFVIFMLIFALIALLGGPIDVNGETATGAAALIQLLPMFINFPVFGAIYAAMLAAFATVGLLIYRIFWPIRIDGVITSSVFE